MWGPSRSRLSTSILSTQPPPTSTSTRCLPLLQLALAASLLAAALVSLRSLSPDAAAAAATTSAAAAAAAADNDLATVRLSPPTRPPSTPTTAAPRPRPSESEGLNRPTGTPVVDGLDVDEATRAVEAMGRGALNTPTPVVVVATRVPTAQPRSTPTTTTPQSQRREPGPTGWNPSRGYFHTPLTCLPGFSFSETKPLRCGAEAPSRIVPVSPQTNLTECGGILLRPGACVTAREGVFTRLSPSNHTHTSLSEREAKPLCHTLPSSALKLVDSSFQEMFIHAPDGAPCVFADPSPEWITSTFPNSLVAVFGDSHGRNFFQGVIQVVRNTRVDLERTVHDRRQTFWRYVVSASGDALDVLPISTLTRDSARGPCPAPPCTSFVFLWVGILPEYVMLFQPGGALDKLVPDAMLTTWPSLAYTGGDKTTLEAWSVLFRTAEGFFNRSHAVRHKPMPLVAVPFGWGGSEAHDFERWFQSAWPASPHRSSVVTPRLVDMLAIHAAAERAGLPTRQIRRSWHTQCVGDPEVRWNFKTDPHDLPRLDLEVVMTHDWCVSPSERANAWVALNEMASSVPFL